MRDIETVIHLLVSVRYSHSTIDNVHILVIITKKLVLLHLSSSIISFILVCIKKMYAKECR